MLAGGLYERTSGAAGQPLGSYQRRAPERTVLHELVARHAQSMLSELRDADPDGGGLPRYVERELAAYLRCGILAHGFTRVRCQTCHDEMVVAFSCKRRGLCPSCTSRRMADTAAHLVDPVLPAAPYRQWVFTVPKPLRLVLARNPAWTRWTGALVVRAIGAWQRRVARKRGLPTPRTGAVTFVQRFGGLVNLNVHFHLVVPDGVFVDDAQGLRFELLPVPTNADVLAILDRLLRRIARRLAMHANAGAFDDDARPDVFAQVQADAATTWRSSTETRATVRGVERLRAWCEGFSLHAGVVVAAHDRAALERLCRYGARPAFAQERLAWTADGRIAYKLKRPWPDGRTHLVMDPVAFLRRLVGIIPPPRRHLVRYSGIFGPASKDRHALRALVPTDRSHEAGDARCTEPRPSQTAGPASRARGSRGPTSCAACSPTTCSSAPAGGAVASLPSSPTLRSPACCSPDSASPPNPVPSPRRALRPKPSRPPLGRRPVGATASTGRRLPAATRTCPLLRRCHRAKRPDPPHATSPRRDRRRETPLELPRRCKDVCGPLTPPGCDCFGCCTFVARQN